MDHRHGFRRVAGGLSVTVATRALVRLCGTESVGENDVVRIDVAGRAAVAVSRWDGEYFVSDDVCPHAEASLSAGYVEDGRIICPVHFAEFDLGSGDVHNPPIGCGKLRFYPVTIIDGAVFADLG